MLSLSFCIYTVLIALDVSALPQRASTSLSSTGSTVSETTSSFLGTSTSLATTTSAQTSSASVTTTSTETTATVSFASTDPNKVDNTTEPIRNTTSNPEPLGATVIGPNNIPIDFQNPDLLAPPTSDHGDVPNAKWSFGQSHNRLQTGGWARQQNTEQMPIATGLAGVNMRLEAGAIRELHWHTAAEWAYVLKGSTQVTAVDSQGRNFLATVGPGDLWYFPPGVPHSLQATNDSADGSEFLLIFPDGAFNEDGTFLLTDWMAHIPGEVIGKNFQVNNAQAFAHIPAEQLYIFPGTPPPDNATDVTSPQGTVPEPFAFAFSKVNATQLSGGTFKIADSSTFTVSTTVAVAEVTVEPGAMRELHWHPTQDEWTFFIEGQGRITIFAAQSNAATFDYQGGDIAYVPASMGHYVENIGTTTLHYLEIFNSDRVEDISLNQWLALTPPELVKAHLDLDDATIAKLTKIKQRVVGPS